MDRKIVTMEDILVSVLEIIAHIKNVQQDISNLSAQSSSALLEYIKQKGELTPEVADGMQLQDIVSQQINSVIDAIDAIESSIAMHLRAVREDNMILHNSFSKLHARLISSFEEAKKRQESLIGRTKHKSGEQQKEDIEFF